MGLFVYRTREEGLSMEHEEKQESGRENTEPQPLTPERLRLSRLGRLGAFPGPEIYEPEEESSPSQSASWSNRERATPRDQREPQPA